MNLAAQAPQKNNNDLIITRNFTASRENIFKVWTKSRHLIHWWGLKGFSMPSHKMDIHPGGIYRCDLKDKNGKDHWVRGVYKEMIEPSHLAFTHAWEENGELTPETLVTVELYEDEGQSRMVFHQAGFSTLEERDNHEEGWTSSFDRLDQYLRETKDF